MENNVTMKAEGNVRVWKEVKCEVNFPNVIWDRSCEFASLKGLTSEQISFNFKMLHNILPINARLHHLKQKDSAVCNFCTSNQTDDRVHSLITCDSNSDIDNWVLACVRKHLPLCSFDDLVNFNLDLDSQANFPMIWFLSNVLSLVWQF